MTWRAEENQLFAYLLRPAQVNVAETNLYWWRIIFCVCVCRTPIACSVFQCAEANFGIQVLIECSSCAILFAGTCLTGDRRAYVDASINMQETQDSNYTFNIVFNWIFATVHFLSLLLNRLRIKAMFASIVKCPNENRHQISAFAFTAASYISLGGSGSNTDSNLNAWIRNVSWIALCSGSNCYRIATRRYFATNMTAVEYHRIICQNIVFVITQRNIQKF